MTGLQCEVPDTNPPSEEIKAILENYGTVAVVGLSPKPERDSHRVAKYLKEHAYTIVPVNPGQKEILGDKHGFRICNTLKTKDLLPPEQRREETAAGSLSCKSMQLPQKTACKNLRLLFLGRLCG